MSFLISENNVMSFLMSENNVMSFLMSENNVMSFLMSDLVCACILLNQGIKNIKNYSFCFKHW